jgi:hypothetical protein
MRRFDWIMEELDFDAPTVTMLVELSDGGKLECSLDETGAEPVLSIIANTDDFAIVEIADRSNKRLLACFDRERPATSFGNRLPSCSGD